ncbi:cobalamin B12-binding domain-containing protein (plasmid) [Natrinema zhouii]|uniref:cobalamin B12-binding domain-containing protein n=1 Tax=Natrinema zhouii TaxID=1710539 RepID=UPI001D000D7D|nr:cobalamin B12-binding domain-containing protein [Natrinema zhouii]UHQ98747.1 cobalamin B12-binding domain-containing protein [Natrinema zhouii]
MAATDSTETERTVRVLIGKPGLDGHDRGAKVVARACRDAGFEVIYSGLRQSPEAIVQTAVQEDVDVLGLSILSGAHDTLVPKIIDLLEEEGMTDVLMLVGGTIPDDDQTELLNEGVDKVFGPDTDINEIVEYVEGEVET